MDANFPKPQQQPPPVRGGGIIAAILRSVAKVVGSIMRDSTIPAIGREAIKDVRSTLNEVFFGKGEHHHEPGAPLNPLQRDLPGDRRGSVYGHTHNTESFPLHRSLAAAVAAHRGNVHGENEQTVQSPAQNVAKDRNGVDGQQQGHSDGQGTAQDKQPSEKEQEWGKRADGKGWAETVQGPKGGTAENPQNNENEQGRQRSLAEEQQQQREEQEHEQGYGR